MAAVPQSIAEFLAARRVAVAGVSRERGQTANAVWKCLRGGGREAFPVNPNATEVEGQRCYPDLRSIPGGVEALMIVTHPGVSADLVRQAAECGVKRVWFHRAFGDGSVSKEALAACEGTGIRPIVGGCPLMYCEPVDPFHRCFGWWLRRTHRISS